LAEIVLDVVSFAGVVAASQAAERLAAFCDQERQSILDRLEASREVEVRAAREYKKTDSTYTTVRQRLENEWEETLLAVQKDEQQLSQFDQKRPKFPNPAQQQTLNELVRTSVGFGIIPKLNLVQFETRSFSSSGSSSNFACSNKRGRLLGNRQRQNTSFQIKRGLVWSSKSRSCGR
jgi:hypothetical protein